MAEMEQELDEVQQKELRDWLVFSGPVIPGLSRSSKTRMPPSYSAACSGTSWISALTYSK